jgi:hypothetical protein
MRSLAGRRGRNVADHKVSITFTADGKGVIQTAEQTRKAVEGIGTAGSQAGKLMRAGLLQGEKTLEHLAALHREFSEKRLVEARRIGQAEAKAYDDVRRAAQKAATGSSDAWLTSIRDWGMAIDSWRNNIMTAIGLVRGAFDTLKGVADMSEMTQNFERSAANAGIWAERFVQAAKKATGGTVDALQIMRTSMRSLNQGLVASEDQIVQLWEIAKTKGETMGIDTAQAFEQLSDIIVRNSERSARQLNVDFGIKMPESFKTATESMTETERQVALLNQVLLEGGRAAREMGGESATAADEFGRLSSAAVDLWRNLVKTEGALQGLAGGIADIIEALNSGAAKEAFERWRQYIYASSPGLGMVGDLFLPNKPDNEFMGRSMFELQEERERAQQSMKTARGDSRDDAEAVQRIAALKERIGKLDQAIAADEEKILKALGKQEAVEKRIANEKAERAKKQAADEEKEAQRAGMQAGKAAARAIDQAREAAIKQAMRDMEAGFTGSGNAQGEQMFVGAAGARSLAAAVGMPTVGMVNRQLADQLKREADQIASDLEEHARTLMLDLVENNPLAVILYGLDPSKLNAGGRTVSLGAGGFGAPGNLFALNSPVMQAMGAAGGASFGPATNRAGTTSDFENVRSFDAEMESKVNAYKDRMRVDVADAFEQGLYDGLNGGNFLKTFGQAIRSQLARALAASITYGMFGTGGGFSLFGGGAAGGGAGASAGGGTGVGSSLGGLMNFGPVMRNGALQTRNLGEYAIAGLAINKLFGEGGIFGSRVTHGAESFGSANEVNSRVSEAAANRDRLYQTVIGVSAATLQQLRELQFASARVVESRSGDGIFSKKTTTYSLDATAANESLEQFAKLQAKVAGEAAAHALDLATANLNDPFTAMEMTIRDLRDLIAKQTDPAEAAGSRANLLTAMRDQERQRWSRSSSLLEAMAASPFSGITSRSAFGSSIETMPMGARQYAMGMFPNLPVTSTGSASFGAVESLLDMNDLMRGINAQNSYDSRMRGAISSGEDSQVTALLTERKAALEAQITALGEVASTLATDIPLSSSIEEATAKFQQWQIAVQGLANASNEVAQIDAQFAADEANRAADAVRRAEEDRQNAAEARAGWTGALLGSAGMWDRTNILVEPPGGLATSVNLARLGRMRMSGKTPVLATASEIFGNATDATQRLDTFAQAILGQTGIEQQARFAQDSIGADPTKLRRIGDNRIGFMRDAVADLQELIDESYGIMLDRTVSLDDQRRAADTYLSALREQAATETEIAQAQWERTEQNESIIREYQSGWFNTLLGNASGALAFNARLTTPMGDSAIQQLAQGTPLSAQNVSNINETDDERAARILNDQILTIRQNHDIGKYQLEKDFAMESMRLAAQGDDKLMAEYVEARQAQLEEESDLFKAMMDDASERLAQAQGDIDKARAAAADYSAAQQAYVSAELEQLQLEAENKEKLKRAQESLTADLVGTFLTRIGEQKTLESGQQVIVLSAGQPDGKQLAQQIRDSVAGADPTLAEALTLFINSVPDTRWSV